MHALPLTLYTCQQVKSLDQLAMKHYSLLPYELMDRAAQAALRVLHHHWHKHHRIAIVCGQGNNGGDGYVLARLAKQKDWFVNVYDVSPQEFTGRSPEAQEAREDWIASGGVIHPIPSVFTEELIVDALLGTGAHFPVAPLFAQAIEAINQSHKAVFALDIPSGLNGDTGCIEGPVVKADVTLTFVGLKMGLVSHQGNDVVGKLEFDHLGLEDSLIAKIPPAAYRIDYASLENVVPHRLLSANKGNQGHVLIVGAGKAQYGGSVCLAGEAALRAGAGLVSVIVAPESLIRSAHAPLELMMTACEEPKEAKDFFERATVLVLGPGLSQSPWGEKWFHYTLSQAMARGVPIVIDADGLNWLSKCPQKVENAVFTPHPGEAARLLNTTVESIQHNRLENAKIIQDKLGGTVVLKGAGTVIINAQQKAYVLAGGFPALATGGTGDVLSGVMGALLAQGMNASEAAQLSVCVHALAAKEQQKQGIRGMMASDLLPAIRRLLNPEDV